LDKYLADEAKSKTPVAISTHVTRVTNNVNNNGSESNFKHQNAIQF